MTVSLQGVVTYSRGSRGYYLQGSDGNGIFVLPAAGAASPDAGRWVSVEGETDAGQIIPRVRNGRLLQDQPSTFKPVARQESFDNLITGRQDAQFVELAGVIRTVTADANRFVLIVGSDGGRLLAEIPRGGSEPVNSQLTDAEVRLRGVIENVYDDSQKLRGLRILLADLSHLSVVQPAQPATNLPIHRIAKLLNFEPNTKTEHRVRLDATVTYCAPGRMVVLQDQTGSILAKTLDPAPLTPGQRVEALGYVMIGEAFPYLEDATFLRTRSEKPIQPLSVSADQVLTNNLHGKLLRIQARLVNQIIRSSELLLFLQSSNTMFTAQLNIAPAPTSSWENGSRVQLTGVCLVQSSAEGEVRDFQLLLRDPADVRVLEAASWWTGRHILMLAALLLALVSLALVWVATLRQRVRRQGRIIRQRLENETALQQRYRDLFRLASDLVFTLDLNGRFSSFNHAAEKLTGYTRAEALGTELARWVAPISGVRCRQWLERCRARELWPQLELQILTQPGRIVTLDVKARYILNGDAPVALQCVARDITEWKRTEAELTAAKSDLQAAHEELRYTNGDLEEAHQSLKEEIAQRQRTETELERVHGQLLIASHEVGMAEVATGVLHNTGNVLNSINASATIITEMLRASRTDQLARAAALLREHTTDLESYLTQDDKGRKLVPYLERLAAHFAEERQTLLSEFSSMRKNVEHITTIIATQQDYAHASGVLERIIIADLIEDAIQVSSQAMTKHSVSLNRQFDELPPALTDRHKVMQILVNLLSNATYACAQSSKPEKRVDVILASPVPGQIVIAVADNGMGIRPENLTRIFSQGFTTRADGHGFGLHSSALAARALGGTLKVHSDGPDCGAVFTLRMPLEARTTEISTA